jgi:hypothetical protein
MVAHRIQRGNLYGSSKDIGDHWQKLPLLTEKRWPLMNRIGFHRIEREGTLHKFGI